MIIIVVSRAFWLKPLALGKDAVDTCRALAALMQHASLISYLDHVFSKRMLATMELVVATFICFWISRSLAEPVAVLFRTASSSNGPEIVFVIDTAHLFC